MIDFVGDWLRLYAGIPLKKKQKRTQKSTARKWGCATKEWALKRIIGSVYDGEDFRGRERETPG